MKIKPLLCSAMMAITTLAVANPVHAQQAASSSAEKFNFDVPPGTLSQVVLAIVAQARANISLQGNAALPVSIEDQNAGQVSVAGVKGTYTLKDAITQALAGSGYSVQPYGHNNAFRIVREGGGEDIIVSARRQDFVNTTSSLLTRTDTPLRQTPGTIDSVTQEVLQSQNAISVGEALRNIPGVIFSNGASASALIGQQSSSGVIFSNGLRGSNYGQNPPVTDVESIEVLKGPASILTGAQVAGGVINLVSKRANGNRIADFSFGVGSGYEVLATADVGGAVEAVDGLAWRLAGTSQYASELPGGGRRPYQRVINPMVGYQVPGFKLFLGFQYYEKRSPYGPVEAYDPATKSFVSYGDRLSDEGASEVTSKRLNYDLEKDIVNSDGLTLKFRSRGQIQWAKQTYAYQVPSAYDLFGLGSLVVNLSSYGHDRQIAQYADVYGKFSTGAIRHQMIVAFDWSQRNNRSANANEVFITSDPIPLTPIPYDGAFQTQVERQYGAILQDQMTWGPLHALVGLRKTWYRDIRHLPDPETNEPSPVALRSVANRLLPNAGVVLDLSDSVSIYFNFSNAFSPSESNLRTVTGEALLPSIRRRYEVGAKTGLFDDKLMVNLALYKFRTSNSYLADLDNPGFYVNAPGSKGEGGEVSVSGSLTKTTRVLAGYSYSTSDLNDGSPVTGAPQDTANLWLMQTLKLGDGQSIDIGAGGNYNSGYKVQDGFTGEYYRISRSYLSGNMSIGYTIGKVTINGTINNIFDRKNYFPSSSTAQNSVDVPRSFRVNLRMKL